MLPPASYVGRHTYIGFMDDYALNTNQESYRFIWNDNKRRFGNEAHRCAWIWIRLLCLDLAYDTLIVYKDLYFLIQNADSVFIAHAISTIYKILIGLSSKLITQLDITRSNRETISIKIVRSFQSKIHLLAIFHAFSHMGNRSSFCFFFWSAYSFSQPMRFNSNVCSLNISSEFPRKIVLNVHENQMKGEW